VKAYQDLLVRALYSGERTENRTGVKTLSLWGETLRVDLAEGFPLLTTKRVHFKSVAEELLWFLRGETNVRSLQARGVTIWDEWADADGNLGPVYGAQWRTFHAGAGSCHDQIADVLKLLKNEPDTRRAVVTAWNPRDVERCKLPPCHYAFQFRRANGRLHCAVNMRSCDLFLGLPFNLASYALLTHLFAAQLGDDVGVLAFSFGDLHLYETHVQQAIEQLKRVPRVLPWFYVREGAVRTPLEELRFDADFDVMGYNPYPKIAAPVAV
jgi:thymidylate synthase